MRRRALVACAIAVVIAPFAVYGDLRAMADMHNDVLQWTAAELESKQRFEWFAEHFEGQELIFVSWPGCVLDDPRLDTFADQLRELARESPSGDRPAVVESVTTSADVWRELTGPPASYSQQDVVRRLRGTLLGPDGQSSCALVVLAKGEGARGPEALALVRAAAEQVADLTADDLKLAGYPVQMAAVDDASRTTLFTLAVPAGVLVLLAAWLFLRNVTLTLAIGVLAGLSQAVAVALVFYLGEPMSGMLAIMPVLVFVIFVSGAVHLINYYTDAARHVAPLEAPNEALRVGGFPCFLAIGTSALGVASLAVSRIQPVRAFGYLTSIGLLVTVAVLLTLLPGVLLLKSRRAVALGRSLEREPSLAVQALWTKLSQWVVRWRLPLQLVSLALAVVCAIGLRHVQTSMQIGDFFTDNSRIIRDYKALETRLGPLFPSEVLLRFDADTTLDMHDRLRLVAAVEDALRAELPQAATVSAVTFTERPITGRGLRSSARRGIVARKLEQHRDELIDKKYLAVIEGYEYWRVTVRQSALDDRTLHDKLAQLRVTVRGALDAHVEDGSDQVTVIHTGLLPLVADAQLELLRGLVLSFATSVVLISGALVVGLRSLRLGVLSTLPNFFPIVIVFGGLGWIGERIDVGTMMTASIGLGIAVDNTVHFLAWFRRAVSQGRSNVQAVRTAYLRCGNAIVRTTVICGTGLILFGLSSFGPARQFGLATCWLLAAALAGDLLLLPALLVGPLGKLVVSKRTKPTPAWTQVAEGTNEPLVDAHR